MSKSQSSAHSTDTNNQRLARVHKPNRKYYNDKFVNHTTAHPLPEAIEPTSATQAKKDLHWKQAMDNELGTFHKNDIWEHEPHVMRINF